ncbi:hypothetical protein H5968_02445 [Sphaerospermopsis sp. LEGE 00249]|nr:hypothetical protein [Sphaerospermopsis sp. LEGE 00249]
MVIGNWVISFPYLLTPVRAKHSENSLFIKLIIFRPNASPLRLLTPTSCLLTPITLISESHC